MAGVLAGEGLWDQGKSDSDRSKDADGPSLNTLSAGMLVRMHSLVSLELGCGLQRAFSRKESATPVWMGKVTPSPGVRSAPAPSHRLTPGGLAASPELAPVTAGPSGAMAEKRTLPGAQGRAGPIASAR